MKSSRRTPKILFAGGGTGGHLFPGLATAAAIEEISPKAKFLFAGTERPLEREILATSPYEQTTLPAEPLRNLWQSPLRFLSRSFTAWRAALKIVDQFKPTTVVGLGGYASVPLLLAARRRKIPYILLEQNTIPGRATRCMATKAHCICVTFDETRAYLPRSCKVLVTGNPLRAEICQLAEAAYTPERKTLVILGGSQGADRLNEAVALMLEQNGKMLEGWDVIHQSGPRQEVALKARYARRSLPCEVHAFIKDMQSVYRRAGIAIARSGATTLSELACAGIPSILVPYPESSDGHQLRNAESFAKRQASLVVEQAADVIETSKQLEAALNALVTDYRHREAMSREAKSWARLDASRRIAAEVLELAQLDKNHLKEAT